jgi:hypothetical protein
MEDQNESHRQKLKRRKSFSFRKLLSRNPKPSSQPMPSAQSVADAAPPAQVVIREGPITLCDGGLNPDIE